jgi:hypothetical protein
MSVILNATDPFHLVYAGQGTGVIANRDTIDTVLLGPSEGSLFRSNPEVSVLDPLTSVPIDGSQDIWAMVDNSQAIPGDDLLAEVDVIATATGWAPSPASIATALISSDFAAVQGLAIAKAIQQGGISLISDPVPIYVAPSNPGASGAGPVGATVATSTYPGSTSRVASSNTFDGFMKQVWAGAFQKYYFNEGVWSGQRLTEMQAMLAAFPNAFFFVTVKPGRSPTGNYSNTAQVTMAPSGATIAQELTNLSNFLTTINGLGFTPTNTDIGMWNEPNTNGLNGLFTGVGFFANYYNEYAPTVRGAGYKCCYNPMLANGQIAGFYPGDANVDKIYVDYYSWDYFKTFGNPPQQRQATLTSAYGDNPMALADNHLPSPIPFGIGETGISNGTSQPSNTDFINWWNTQIVAPMLARIGAGKVNAGIAWFDLGQGNNLINVSTPAPQLAAMRNGYNVLSNLVVNPTINGTVLAPSSTTTLTPVNPSPSAGFASINEMSYSVVVRIQANAAGNTNSFIVVRLFWFETDDPHAQAVDTQFWICPIGGSAAGPITLTGHGPQTAAFLKVQLQNLDTVACTVNFSMTGESRVAASKHDWRWDAASSNNIASGGAQGYTLPGGAFHANSLGALHNGSLAAAATQQIITGLQAGQTWLHFTADNNKVTASLTPVPPSSWGTAELWSGVGPIADAMIAMPRSPAQLTVTNTDTVAHAFTFELIGGED